MIALFSWDYDGNLVDASRRRHHAGARGPRRSLSRGLASV